MILKLFVTVNIVYTMTACVQFMYAWQMLLMRVWVGVLTVKNVGSI